MRSPATGEGGEVFCVQNKEVEVPTGPGGCAWPRRITRMTDIEPDFSPEGLQASLEERLRKESAGGANGVTWKILFTPGPRLRTGYEGCSSESGRANGTQAAGRPAGWSSSPSPTNKGFDLSR
jgi:hypothetical protein